MQLLSLRGLPSAMPAGSLASGCSLRLQLGIISEGLLGLLSSGQCPPTTVIPGGGEELKRATGLRTGLVDAHSQNSHAWIVSLMY